MQKSRESIDKQQESMSGSTIEMPKYKSHKIVWALKIKGIEYDSDLAKLDGNRETDGSAMITPEEKGYVPFKVDHDYLRKHKPEVGGYYVVYKDGYKSFSPAKAFEEGNTKVEDIPTSPGPYGSLHLGRGNFGQAIQALKDGKKVARSGWNGKGAWLRHVKNGCPSVAGNVGTVHLGNDGVWAINDFVGMKTTDKMFVPWSPSQTDILAEDWTLVE